jgi:hypothetical protein
MTQGPNTQVGQTGERVAQLSRREHERDPLRQQAARHERQSPRRGTIEPMRVVDDTHEWLLLGGLGEQAEDRQSHQEWIRCRVRRPPNQAGRDAKRLSLRLWEALHQLEKRGAQLLDRRERKLYLRLDPERPDDPKPPRGLDRLFEQRRLADTRLPVYHQHAATPASHFVQQPLEHLALALPTDQRPARGQNR